MYRPIGGRPIATVFLASFRIWGTLLDYDVLHVTVVKGWLREVKTSFKGQYADFTENCMENLI